MFLGHYEGTTSILTEMDGLTHTQEDEELLLRQLERRKSWAGALEAAENRNPFRILASALALLLFAALCVLSHPALGLLPQAIYFPCLGAAFLSLYALVWFILRQRLGE